MVSRVVPFTSISLLKVVIDTNVLIAALRSQNGASYQLLLMWDSDKSNAFISVPLFTEYESVAKRLVVSHGLDITVIDDILDYLCLVSSCRREIYYLWRPFLRDPSDDMVLELAVAAECEFIVTFNQADFKGAEQFGIRVLTPKELLKLIGEL